MTLAALSLILSDAHRHTWPGLNYRFKIELQYEKRLKEENSNAKKTNGEWGAWRGWHVMCIHYFWLLSLFHLFSIGHYSSGEHSGEHSFPLRSLSFISQNLSLCIVAAQSDSPQHRCRKEGGNSHVIDWERRAVAAGERVRREWSNFATLSSTSVPPSTTRIVINLRAPIVSAEARRKNDTLRHRRRRNDVRNFHYKATRPPLNHLARLIGKLLTRHFTIHMHHFFSHLCGDRRAERWQTQITNSMEFSRGATLTC